MSQGQTFQYDPSQVVLNVGGKDINGFAEGTFIKVERNKDAFELVVGSDGEGTRVKSVNLSGTITCTLQQASPSNDDLSGFATSDERTSNGAVPVLMTDKNNSITRAAMKVGWIKKKPSTEFSNAHSNREWVIESANLQFDIGGETQIG